MAEDRTFRNMCSISSSTFGRPQLTHLQRGVSVIADLVVYLRYVMSCHVMNDNNLRVCIVSHTALPCCLHHTECPKCHYPGLISAPSLHTTLARRHCTGLYPVASLAGGGERTAPGSSSSSSSSSRTYRLTWLID